TDTLLEAGARVVVCGRNEPESLPDRVEFLQADVREADSVDELFTAIVDRHGRLDIAVNNAGGSPGTEAATASPRFSERVLSLNFTAALHVAVAANRVMQRQDEGGSIINITSLSGHRPSPGTAVYGAAKAGLLNLTTSLAM